MVSIRSETVTMKSRDMLFTLAIPLPFDQSKVFEVLANHPYFYFRVKLKFF